MAECSGARAGAGSPFTASARVAEYGNLSLEGHSTGASGNRVPCPPPEGLGRCFRFRLSVDRIAWARFRLSCLPGSVHNPGRGCRDSQKAGWESWEDSAIQPCRTIAQSEVRQLSSPCLRGLCIAQISFLVFPVSLIRVPLAMLRLVAEKRRAARHVDQELAHMESCVKGRSARSTILSGVLLCSALGAYCKQ